MQAIYHIYRTMILSVLSTNNYVTNMWEDLLMNLDQKYHNITNCIADGCIEIGRCDEYTDSTARVMDEGGVAWETNEDFPTLEAALDAIERGIEE